MSTEALATVNSLTPQQQKGWLTLGAAKQDLARRHELATLELQKILQDAEPNITSTEEALSIYRKKHADMIAEGQKFRGVIKEKIMAQSLQIEANYDPKNYEGYKVVNERLIKMKTDQEERNSQAQRRAQERNNYIAHKKNQYELLAADYKQRALNEINTMYISYLKGKVQDPDVEAIRQTITDLKFDTSEKVVGTQYQRKYITDDEAKAIMADLEKPNLPILRNQMIVLLDQKFSSYQHDLKANTVEQVEMFAQQEVQEIKQEAEMNVGINNLTAQAVDVPSVMAEGKPLTRAVKVVVEDSEAWHLKVITAYLKFPLCRAHVGVKKWSNLTVGQMAAALGAYATETGEMSAELEYEELIK